MNETRTVSEAEFIAGVDRYQARQRQLLEILEQHRPGDPVTMEMLQYAIREASGALYDVECSGGRAPGCCVCVQEIVGDRGDWKGWIYNELPDDERAVILHNTRLAAQDPLGWYHQRLADPASFVSRIIAAGLGANVRHNSEPLPAQKDWREPKRRPMMASPQAISQFRYDQTESLRANQDRFVASPCWRQARNSKYRESWWIDHLVKEQPARLTIWGDATFKWRFAIGKEQHWSSIDYPTLDAAKRALFDAVWSLTR
jgi:hypothetical protein